MGRSERSAARAIWATTLRTPPLERGEVGLSGASRKCGIVVFRTPSIGEGRLVGPTGGPGCRREGAGGSDRAPGPATHGRRRSGARAAGHVADVAGAGGGAGEAGVARPRGGTRAGRGRAAGRGRGRRAHLDHAVQRRGARRPRRPAAVRAAADVHGRTGRPGRGDGAHQARGAGPALRLLDVRPAHGVPARAPTGGRRAAPD
jgi:hypothetical protein